LKNYLTKLNGVDRQGVKHSRKKKIKVMFLSLKIGLPIGVQVKAYNL